MIFNINISHVVKPEKEDHTQEKYTDKGKAGLFIYRRLIGKVETGGERGEHNQDKHRTLTVKRKQ